MFSSVVALPQPPLSLSLFNLDNMYPVEMLHVSNHGRMLAVETGYPKYRSQNKAFNPLYSWVFGHIVFSFIQ